MLNAFVLFMMASAAPGASATETPTEEHSVIIEALDTLVDSRPPAFPDMALAPLAALAGAGVFSALAVGSLFIGASVVPALVLLALAPLAGAAAASFFVRPLTGPALVALAGGLAATLSITAATATLLVAWRASDGTLAEPAAPTLWGIGAGALLVPVAAALSAALVASPKAAE